MLRGNKKKMSERRQERKNETIIMGKLDNILANQAATDTEIAVIKTEQKNTNDHLKTLNGKVVTQEGRQQASDSAIALITQSVSVLQDQIKGINFAKSQEEEKKLNFWERNADKLFWAIAMGLIALMFAKFK